MNILFICSALEPGRDGVGDYTRRLAGQLILDGHQVAILSLNDTFIKTDISGAQSSDGASIPVFRIAPAGTYPERVAKAKPWVDSIKPDWLSLQFVSFGFHPKGLQLGFGKALKALGSSYKCHIMFHELWVGMDKQSSLKFKIWAWLQKQLIIALIKALKPAAISTQTHLYQSILETMGHKADFLPLFGNIPLVNTSVEKDDVLRFAIFGSIHYGAPINEIAAELAAWSRMHNQPVKVVIMGHCWSEQIKWVTAFKKQGIIVEELGLLPADQVSIQLQKADVGISSTPLLVSQKSGSVAAMRDHRLPVICVARPWDVTGADKTAVEQWVFNYKPGNLGVFMNQRQQYIGQTLPISKIASQLIHSLHGKF